MNKEIKYCVNYKGQKIKPYKSTYISPKKQTDWDKIVNYACLIATIIVFIAGFIYCMNIFIST